MSHVYKIEPVGERYAIMILYDNAPSFKLAGFLSPLEPDGPTKWIAYIGRSTRVIRSTKKGAAAAFLKEYVL